MSNTIDIWITSRRETIDRVTHKLRGLFDVLDEREEAGDNGLVRKVIKIEAHSSRLGRIEVTIAPGDDEQVEAEVG